ncbi:hypothetical protein BDP27DRAFT_1423179 [Rhodocollybia butyracea]|uniref:Uncharacterized protein n=1 Tax=Rhodocollybia butyracea TaxID=206335 RepID=A0A9P5U6S8_9AGAR|nr:hypothetical protein BDP27DRAFT_1423179 [Rhodocollybia butyracea]
MVDLTTAVADLRRDFNKLQAEQNLLRDEQNLLRDEQNLLRDEQNLLRDEQNLLRRRVFLYAPTVKNIYRSHIVKASSMRIYWKSHDPPLSSLLKTPSELAELDRLFRSVSGFEAERRLKARLYISDITDYLIQKQERSLLNYLKTRPPTISMLRSQYSHQSIAFWRMRRLRGRQLYPYQHSSAQYSAFQVIGANCNDDDTYNIMPEQLASFLSLEEDSPDHPLLASLYQLIFGYPYTLISSQPTENSNTEYRHGLLTDSY